MLFKEIVKGDRTIRKFSQKEINPDQLKNIMENVRLAHCGNNRQVLTYYVVTDEGLRSQVAQKIHYAALLGPSAGQPKKGEEAMTYIVIVKPDPGTPIQDIDTGIAAEVITASAYEEGIASCMMLNFNPAHINDILNIPAGQCARMVIALGYGAITSTVVDVKENGNVDYYIDDKNNYYVPKRQAKDIVRWK